MDYVAVGKIVGCFGIRGLLKVQVFGPSPERLSKLESGFLGSSADRVEPCSLEQVEVREHQGVMVKFRGVDDRTAAEKLVGQYLFVSEPDVVQPGKGSFFIDDLLGCEVETLDGVIVGKVAEVYKLPAQDVWAVRNGKEEYLIPAVKEFVKEVDLQRKRITLQVIEGLLDRSTNV